MDGGLLDRDGAGTEGGKAGAGCLDLRVPGVLAAEVSLGTERARVRVAAGTAGPGELIAAVQAAGYGAALPGAASPSAHGPDVPAEAASVRGGRERRRWAPKASSPAWCGWRRTRRPRSRRGSAWWTG